MCKKRDYFKDSRKGSAPNHGREMQERKKWGRELKKERKKERKKEEERKKERKKERKTGDKQLLVVMT